MVMIFCLSIYRFLAHGDSFSMIAFNYRVGVSTVSLIVRQVATAIWESMVDECMPVPTMADWKTIAQTFHQRWNFPNCVGAIDGKHVVIQSPFKSGSLFRNYKKTFSIVLLAVVDANYIFRVVDVGGYGKSNDAATLYHSAFGEALRDGNLDLPPDAPIPGAERRGPLPHVFIADEAFPLRRDLMRPFPGKNITNPHRIFNYRLSRARLDFVFCVLNIVYS